MGTISIMKPCSLIDLHQPVEKPRVVLRADAGSVTGYGHFVRSVALASYLRNDFDCVVATCCPDAGVPSDWQLSLVDKAGASLLSLTATDLDSFDSLFIDSLAPDDIVVLDNYYFTTEYQRRVRSCVRALVCIDDMHDRHFVADVVVTVCPLTREDFSFENYTRFYGGVDRAFLREPFFAPAVRRECPEVVRQVAVAMGGADPFHLTDSVILALRRILPDVKIDVIAGQSVRVSESGDHIHVYRQASASDIVEIFDNADVGVFPASTVCVEAFARHLPVMAGYYVDNQRDFYEYGVAHGWFAPLGWLPDGEACIENRLREMLRRGVPQPPAFDFEKRKREMIDIFKSLAS